MGSRGSSLTKTILHVFLPSLIAMVAMKAMKAKQAGMTASGAYSAVAETTGLKPKQVKETMEALVALAAKELKAHGNFKIGGAFNLKLKPATKARKGVNPFTKEPCVFKAKPASQTVRALPMKKFKEMIN